MTLSHKQHGVAKGMAGGFILSLLALCWAALANPIGLSNGIDLTQRTEVFAYSILLPVILLIVSVGRLAKHRFFNAQDIDGSGLTQGSQQAKLLQSLLQNTLEQFCIAIGAYAIGCLLLPAVSLASVPVCSLLFFIGRILFFMGYSKGAPSRALGFTLTFYSSALLLLITLVLHLFG